tara:strand:+ start:14853 stop:15509 length:657 start_codon:yes stop_codon:yes gene_type:complete
MNVGLEALIVIVLILVIIYLVYLHNYNANLLKVKSTIDNTEYYVQDKEDAQDAANLIAKIKDKLKSLIEHLSKQYPSDERTIRIKQNYRENSLKEGVDDPNYTSYSVNKGEQIILCLRNKDKLMDLNTMMFVVLHEIGHLASESIGHTDEFWSNFKWILEESINIGIYVRQDFDSKPVEYCGMSITSSPLDNESLSSFPLETDKKIVEGFKLNRNYRF